MKTYNTSLYVDYLFVSVIVLIIIASIFDFNVNGGIINGVGGGEDVQYKLICRLFVCFSHCSHHHSQHI